MVRFIKTFLILLCVSDISLAQEVYYNANVYTSDISNPTATAFVVKNGKFIYVGNDIEALKYGKGIDLGGKRVVPGFIDSHCHTLVVSLWQSQNLFPLELTMTKQQVLECVVAKSKEEPYKSAKLLLGRGFGADCNGSLLASDLDEIDNTRPVILVSEDGHSLWCNSKALKQANITAQTPDPIPGSSYFIRDKQGNPTGYVVEMNATYQVLRSLGAFKKEGMKKYLPALMAQYHKWGHTAIFDAGVLVISEEEVMQGLSEMEREGTLTMKYTNSYVYNGPSCETPQAAVKNLDRLAKKYRGDKFGITTLKMFTDGTLEVQSAKMLEPYNPPAHGTGAFIVNYGQQYEAARLAANLGYNIHTHNIGDHAVSDGLRMFDSLGSISGNKTMAHVQILPPDGIERFIKQGDIFYQTTPFWLLTDEYTKQVLGNTRYMRQMPLNSIKNGGVKICFGSDSTGEENGYNPFYNSWCAVNRAFDDGSNIIGPQSEAITIEDCIDAYTINGAMSIGMADRLGSITVGKDADFVILNQDVLTIEPMNIKDVTVERTYSNGKCIFE